MKNMLFFLLFVPVMAWSQTPESLLAEGRKLEQQFKEGEALEKYKRAILIKPDHIPSLLRIAEVCASIGGRETAVGNQSFKYFEAKTHAETALNLDSTLAETQYTMAMVMGKLAGIETDRDKLIAYMLGIKKHAEKAIALNPKFGKAYHILGKWHLELLQLGSLKKAAIKLIYGGLPPVSIDSAIALLETCKSLEPYYCLNFLDLGKAYHYNKKYEKALAVLEQLAKLPTRRQDDMDIKKEGAALFQQLN